jgi:multiple sugar transport system substrate-binding protein
MHVHPPRLPLDKDLIAKFEKDNPTIKVDYKTVPDQEWDTTLATALASGSGPDLFNQATFAMGQYYAQGVIVPVDPAAAGYADQNAVVKAYESGEALLAGATFDGKLYGLPTELSTYACYTNDDLWKKAGLDPQKDFPATWEDMKTVAEKLTVRDSSGALTQRGFDFIWSNSIFMLLVFNAMVQQLGGNMIDETNYTANINTPEVKQVLSYWNDWANTWKLGGPQYTFIRDDFLAGKVAIDCDGGNWFAPQAETAKINYSIHPIPVWKDAKNKNGFANYAYFFMVNSNASPEVQKAAWKLAAYMTSEPGRALKEAGLFQAKADFVASEEFKSNKIMPVFLQTMGVSTYHPRIAGFFEVADSLMRMRDRVVTGHEDIDKVLTEAQTEVSDILKRAQEEAKK